MFRFQTRFDPKSPWAGFAFLIGLCVLTFPARADELEGSKLLFADSLSKLDTAQQESVQTLRSQYLQALDRLRTAVVQTGNLEEVLRIEEEKQWLEQGSQEPPVLAEDATDELKNARKAFAQARLSIEADRNQKRSRLADAYLAHLETLQRKRVQENNIEGAIQCREEIGRIQAMKAEWAPTTIPLPTVPAPGPDKDGIRVRWHPREDMQQVAVQASGGTRKEKLATRGKHSVSLRGLDVREQGTTHVPGLGEQVTEACKKAHAVTVVVGLETADLKQTGPARILSLSKDTLSRNLTLGQEGDQLVLRLRTTETDLNGTKPQISLGKLIIGSQTQVALSYSAETGLICYRDGKELKTERIGGSLENWETMGLFLGNEATHNRPWSGSISLFEIRSEAVDASSLMTLSRER